MKIDSAEIRAVQEWHEAVELRGLWVRATTHYSGIQARWITECPRPASDWCCLPSPGEILDRSEDVLTYRPVLEEDGDDRTDHIELEAVQPTTDRFGTRLHWGNDPELDGEGGLILYAEEDEFDWRNPLLDGKLQELGIEVEDLREFFEELSAEHPEMVAKTTVEEEAFNMITRSQRFFTTTVRLGDPAWETVLHSSAT